jgi:hypothetical protein
VNVAEVDSLIKGDGLREEQPVSGLTTFTDGHSTADALDEFVEVYNASGSAIDIGGLELWDDGQGQWFSFSASTTLV